MTLWPRGGGGLVQIKYITQILYTLVQCKKKCFGQIWCIILLCFTIVIFLKLNHSQKADTQLKGKTLPYKYLHSCQHVWVKFICSLWWKSVTSFLVTNIISMYVLCYLYCIYVVYLQYIKCHPWSYFSSWHCLGECLGWFHEVRLLLEQC